MKAMIFAAGLGTRLRPLTDSRPKALVEVGGVTMLERVIIRLRRSGVSRIVVNTHHFPDMIARFLNDRDFGIEILISDERSRLLDTGGGVLRARRMLDGDEPIIVHNADILTDFPIEEMAAAHESSGAMATLLTDRRKSSRGLLFDDGGQLRGWMRADGSEVIPPELATSLYTMMAFGGVHVISPSVFPLLERYASANGEVFSIIPFYLSIMNGESVRSYTPSETYRWFDIGSPAKLEAAENALGAANNF